MNTTRFYKMLAGIMIGLLPLSALASTAIDAGQTPEQVVHKYLELYDSGLSITMRGTKRSIKLRDEMERITLREIPLSQDQIPLSEGPITVDYRSIYNRYSIKGSMIKNDYAEVSVQFEYIGSITDLRLFAPFYYLEEIKIITIKKNNKWYVRGGGRHPANSARTVIALLNEKRTQAKTKNSREIVDRAIRQIQELSKLYNLESRLEDISLETFVAMYFYKHDMDLSQKKYETYMLNLSEKDLQLLRNTIFARHKYDFQTFWIKRYFADRFYEYWQHHPKLKEIRLTDLEENNIEYLRRLEETVKRRRSE